MLSKELSKKLDFVIRQIDVLLKLSSKLDQKDKFHKKKIKESSLDLHNPKSLLNQIQLDVKSDCTNLLPKI